MVWTASIISGLSLITLGVRSKKKKTTVKMLTQDGQLVEVEQDMLPAERTKISNSHLRDWIKGKKL